MKKRQLIDDIREHNPTAQVEFLSQFDESALEQYLDHLQAAKAKVARRLDWAKPVAKVRMAS